MKKTSRCIKVIIDSNIWISFLIGKSLQGLQHQIDDENIIIITCTEQYIELSEVFKKPRLQKFFTKEQTTRFFELLDESSEVVELKTKTNLCRDPKDNYLVSLAIDSEANFLVTGDNDLIDLYKIGETLVLRYSDFVKIVQLQ